MTWEKPQLFSLEEVAQMFRVPKDTVVKWVDRGLLPSVMVEDDFRVEGHELDRFIEERKLAAQRAVAASRQQAEQEERTYYHLYRWVDEENRQLIGLFRNLDQAVLAIGENLRDELDRSSDRLRARALRESLHLLYERWEKTSRSYRNWILDQEGRWQKYQSEVGLPLGLALVPPADLGGDVSRFLDTDSLMARTLAGDIADPFGEGGLYGHLYRWSRGEHESLMSHYKDLERSIEGLIEELQQRAGKAGQNLELERGMALHDASSIVQRYWDGVRRGYNQWLVERTERWNRCRGAITRELSAAPGEHGQDGPVMEMEYEE